MWSEKRKFGNIGEDIACTFLMKQGFEIVERNYSRKWGELDIVARKGSKLHFVEVKSVSCTTLNYLFSETGQKNNDYYRPEENIHGKKRERLKRAIQTYILERRVPHETEWIFDVVLVYIENATGKSKVEFMEDVIL